MPFTGFVAANYSPSVAVANPETGQPYQSNEATVAHTVIERADGLDVIYSVTNTSGTSIPPPTFNLNIGWTGSTGPTKRWVANWKWKERNTPSPFTTTSIGWYYGGGTSACNCIAWGDGTDTFGIGFDYPYATYINELPGSGSNWRSGWKPLHTTVNQRRVIPDWIRPGQTASYKFWMRRVSGTGDAAAVEAVRPYAEYIRTKYPKDHPRKLTGRVASAYVAGGGAGVVVPGADGRHYASIFGKPISQYAGMYELASAVVSYFGGIEAFRRCNYQAVMIWALSGTTNSDQDFRPSVVRNLPPNLAGTLGELNLFLQNTGIEVWLWMGRTHSAIQTGAWNSDNETPLQHGWYSTDGSFAPLFNRNDWKTWELKPEAVREFNLNTFEGAKHCRGLGFDADVDMTSDPWIRELYERLRRDHPGLWFANESQKTDRTQQYCPAYFFPPPEDGGAYEGRCPLMDAIYPDSQNMVHVYASNLFPGYAERVAFIESQGDVALTQGVLVDIPYGGYVAPPPAPMPSLPLGLPVRQASLFPGAKMNVNE